VYGSRATVTLVASPTGPALRDLWGGVRLELLLWRWSTLVQITSDLMIAVFFVALARSVGRRELNDWVVAWALNFAALAITIAYWLLQPSAAWFPLTAGTYTLAKNLFIALLASGVIRFSGGQPTRLHHALVGSALVLFSVGIGLFVPSIDVLGAIESLTIGLGFAVGTFVILALKPPAWGWLAAGFAVRALLALGEGTVFTMQVALGTKFSPTVGAFFAAHSSFDTGAEWIVVLGCVLTVYRTIQQELTLSNAELRAAQTELQALLDRDQLTGVFNRRALPAILRESQAAGATVLFFDLDEFKKINDTYGHQAGDECLKRFAQALQASFRSGDFVVRYAGDEFVVVAAALGADERRACIETVRGHLRFRPTDSPHIAFSVGHAQLGLDVDPDATLRAADEAMYRDKAA